MKIQIRSWQKSRNRYSGMGVALDRVVLDNGWLSDPFTGELETAMENGLLWVQADGTHIFYCKDHFNQLPDAELFLRDMEALAAKKVA